MSLKRKFAAGLLVAAATLVMSGAMAQPHIMVLQGGTLIDGTGAAPLSDAVVVIQGDRITAVGKKGQVRIPGGAQIIDLKGRTILPGLIDSHIHFLDFEMPFFLHYGITSVLDKSNDPAWIVAGRDAVRKGVIKGPRFFVSGAIMTGTQCPGSGSAGLYNYPLLQSAKDAHDRAEFDVAQGYDTIVIIHCVKDDELKAAIDVGKESGLPVMGHVQNMKRAGDLGMKFMEHMWPMGTAILDPEETSNMGVGGRGSFPPESLVNVRDIPPLVDYMVKQQIYANPTLVNHWSAEAPRGKEYVAETTKLMTDPQLGFVPEVEKEGWNAIPSPFRAGYSKVAEFLKQYAAAGGKIVVGTDAGQRVVPGLSEHYEMQYLVDLGETPMQAIQGATLWNAQLIHKDKDIGSVQVGKFADFTIIEGDPLANIANTRNVRMVILGGKVVDTKYDPKWVNPIPSPYASAIEAPPVVAKVAPAVVHQNAPTVTLTIDNGANGYRMFKDNAIVRFDNVDLPTHYVSRTQLTATLDASLLKRAPGTYPVYVLNPGIHGTVSSGGFVVIDTADAPVTNIPLTFAAYAARAPKIYGPTPRMARQGDPSVNLQVDGERFAPNAVVRFDNVDLPTKFVSPTKLTAVIDAKLLQKPLGSYPLYVVNPGSYGIVSETGYFLVNMKQ